GNVATRFKVLGDSLVVGAYARFSNTEVPYLLKNYVSNHFIWHNDFGKERRLRLGGRINLKRTGTRLEAGVENLQNYVYFNQDCMPVQAGGSVQVVGATLGQDFHFGPVTWANSVTWQTSSDESVIPLPKLSVYTNLSVQFKIAKVLAVQLGLDCSYFTEYKSISYQPATMTFYNQRDIKCGNYPFVNAFINMRLSRVRFYVMMSHVNQGLTGDNYFSMPHYPLNPRRFQMGLCIDFQN
ncbi:MAG: putative porin, partial [Muribaculum sp.]|nr:putative porin [Muribaculum sp.]